VYFVDGIMKYNLEVRKNIYKYFSTKIVRKKRKREREEEHRKNVK
jgi:hypothetical protein